MADERIDIVITERGSRVIIRNLQDIGGSARRSADAVDFLRRALAALGGAVAARELVSLLDTYTNLRNRLRATGLEAQNLTAVYRELLAVANDTGSGFQGSVELYSRLAVSSKELGVSQQDLIEFTKSLNQAIILSGASATEAQAGLIQLSQGMASGTLRGDELRSVLEQLPAVADVIAKELGVTRGELRKMGEDGKITAGIILDAFKNARDELEQRFGTTVLTIGQSFQVLKNNLIDLIGQMDEATGVSGLISRALLFVSKNLEVIAKVA
ncbi:MAG: tape measure protein, partial [Methanomethylophilus sp.]